MRTKVTSKLHQFNTLNLLTHLLLRANLVLCFVLSIQGGFHSQLAHALSDSDLSRIEFLLDRNLIGSESNQLGEQKSRKRAAEQSDDIWDPTVALLVDLVTASEHQQRQRDHSSDEYDYSIYPPINEDGSNTNIPMGSLRMRQPLIPAKEEVTEQRKRAKLCSSSLFSWTSSSKC